MKVDKLLMHPKFSTSRKNILATLQFAGPGSLVFVVGISGVGKSELRYEAMRTLSGPSSNWTDGEMPAVAVRATLTDRGFFNPKDLAMRLAYSLRHPDVSWLQNREEVEDPDVVHVEVETARRAPVWAERRRNSTEHGLRFEFERHAQARRLRWLFIEEGTSICTVPRGRSVHNYMMGLMQLAEECSLTIVLFGTPRAAALWDSFPDVRRRSLFVWVERYREDRAEDHLAFGGLVMALARQYPLSSPDLLVNNLELALTNSAGSFGELKQFLARADQARRRRQAESIGTCDLISASYSRDQILSMWEVAKEFDRLQEPNVLARDLSHLDLAWAGGLGSGS
ncbi:AAA family ATPase [Xanthomonas hortorum]